MSEPKPCCSKCGHPPHRAECYDCIRYDLRDVCTNTPAPSPARDDAETCPKCGESLDKHPTMDMSKGVLFLCPVAAPDELTALREKVAQLEKERDTAMFERKGIQTARDHEYADAVKLAERLAECRATEQAALDELDVVEAERDALRERIAAVRVLLDDTTTGGLMIKRAPIRAALGDA